MFGSKSSSVDTYALSGIWLFAIVSLGKYWKSDIGILDPAFDITGQGAATKKYALSLFSSATLPTHLVILVLFSPSASTA